MDPIKLVQTDYFWCVSGIAAAILVFLRILAGREVTRARTHGWEDRHGNLQPLGAFGISIGGKRIVQNGPPRARFVNPAVFLSYLCSEPTLLIWYVAGWLLLLQDWANASNWLLAGFIWRISWDVVFRHSCQTSFGSRMSRALVKCAWACASGIFYAALSIAFVVILTFLLMGLALLMSGRGNGRKRRQW